MSRARAVFVLAAACAVAVAACDDCSGNKPTETSDAGAAATDDAAEDVYSIKVPSPEGGVVNATTLSTAEVAKALNPENLPEYKGDTGSIEGTISVDGDPPLPTPADFSRCPAAEKTWGTSYREGPPTDGGARALADAVVAITGYKGFFVPEKSEAKQVTIEGCAYTTRTVTLTFGQRLEVKNMSRDLWTPVLEPGPTSVMMMAVPGGDPVKIYPKKPGHYLLLDHDRRYVDVDVYAFLHPLHTASDLAGHYRIDGVPVGKVTVNTTHPRFTGEAAKEIEVRPGLVQTVDLVLHHVQRDAAAPAPSGSVAAPASASGSASPVRGKDAGRPPPPQLH